MFLFLARVLQVFLAAFLHENKHTRLPSREGAASLHRVFLPSSGSPALFLFLAAFLHKNKHRHLPSRDGHTAVSLKI